MPERSRPPKRPDLGLAAPKLCVDFANTARTQPFHQGGARNRKLPPAVRDYHTLIDWAVWAGALTAPQVQGYRAGTEKALDVYSGVLELRKLLVDVCVTIRDHALATSEQAAAVATYLDACPVRLDPDPNGFGYVPRFVLPDDHTALQTVLAGSAFRMLTIGRPPVIRICNGRDCTRFVLSTTGRDRIWCEPRLCQERHASRQRR